VTSATFTTDPTEFCRDEQRRAHILAHPSLNGIDFVEYVHRPLAPIPHVLVVSFLKPLPDPPHSDPDGAYGLTAHPEQVVVEGGTRVVGIEVLGVRQVDDHLEIDVDQAGDFSDYSLLLGWARQEDGDWLHVAPALDEPLSVARVNFKAACPVDFDCRPAEICPPKPTREPLIDYLAKDYASFRQLLLDRISQLNPDWLERSPADLGIALVELLAYEGDHLSYFQDAVANEAFLDTVRQRVSAKRHARLIDYRMHDGRNAWTFVHVEASSVGTIPQGTKILSRVTAPLRHKLAPPLPVIPHADVEDEAFESDPALVRVRVFETAFPLAVHPENNTIFLHAWGNVECCAARGATSAAVYSVEPSNASQATRPELQVGDYLLFEEVKGPTTGNAADADAAHRQVVRLVDVEEAEDAAFRDQLQDGQLQAWQDGDMPLPLLRIKWRTTDALAFPLCLSTRPPGRGPVLNVSIARGNIVLADHGRPTQEEFPQSEPVPADQPVRLRLTHGPLTLQCQPDDVEHDPLSGELATPRTELMCHVRDAKPAIALRVDFPAEQQPWSAVPDLLDSPPFARHFVTDVDRDGRATLRFGDGEHGREPAGAIGFRATYRIGNGRRGNVAREALAHVVQPIVAPGWPAIDHVRNPLPARDGADPETIEEVRQRAPAAFRAEQFRAVTEADYAAAARKMPDVAEAVATFRWTGSWYTVFVGVDPRDPEDLLTESGGRTRLAATFERRVRAFLTRYKLAGYDLEIVAGHYVPLDIELAVCVAPGHFRADVAQAVHRALSNRVNPDHTLGFFHPDHFTFGQAVYLSRLYAVVESVPGVDSLVMTRFQRYGAIENGELQAGILPIGPWEIARLDNDPNFMENGLLRVNADGGK
jgi:hypothetical protein